IELLHESGNSNKRDRDGNRVQNMGQGQQEIRGRQDQSVEYRGHQDRGYDSKRQDFRGQDQRLRLPPVTSSYYMRAGIRISGIEMNRGQGQQEIRGRYDQGQHVYRGRQDQSVEYRGRQDRGYDSKRQDFRGQDQRSAGRNGNDRQGQGNYNQRQHRNQSTWDLNQGHALGSLGQRRSTETLPPPPLCATCGKPHPGVCYKATGGCFTCGSTQHK
nr:zinc finger, CCHC-type, retrotransposon Gag domain protein [Tanacetum cinerariifolium]